MTLKDISRRRACKTLSYAALSLPFMTLSGCGESSGSTTTTTAADSSASQAATAASYESASTTVDTALSWASGGTDLISVDFPDDTIFESANSCSLSLTETTTEGPCYLGVSEKEDISEGKEGLPMQLCLQLLDSSCTPLVGYLIEVWHCDNEGIYSGDTTQSDDTSTFAGDFCTGGDALAKQSVWYRGELVTDSSGRVNFKSCFPGWYSGRTIHIHYRVRLNNGGSDYVVSQFCFDDTFAEDICTTHELYAARGVQNTPLSSGKDTVFPAAGYEPFLMNVAQNSDGTLLAYHKIMITA